MSKVYLEDSTLTNIANAIRSKNGETTTYKPNEMAEAISNIEGGGGGEPTKISQALVGKYENDTSLSGSKKYSELFADLINDRTYQYDLTNYFKGCSNITSFDAGQVSNICNAEGFFDGCTSLSTLKQLDLSNAVSLKNTFSNCINLLSPTNYVPPRKPISFEGTYRNCALIWNFALNKTYIDASYCESFEETFMGTTQARSIVIDVDTSRAKTFARMFKNSGIASLDLSNLKTSNSLNYDGMFSGCSSLRFVDMSNFEILGHASAVDVFEGCTSLQEIKCPKVVDIDVYLPCDYLDADNNYTSTNKLVAGHTLIKQKRTVLLKYGGLEVTSWNEEDVYGLSDYNFNGYQEASVNLLTSDSYGVANGVYWFIDTKEKLWLFGIITSAYSDFRSASGLSVFQSTTKEVFFSIDMGNYSLANAFNWYYSIEKISFGKKCKTDRVSNMRSFLYGCRCLKEVDFTNFSISKCTNFDSFFKQCYVLEEIDWKNMKSTVEFTSSSSYLDFYSAFAACYNLKIIKNFDFFKDYPVGIGSTFNSCYALEEYDFNMFNLFKKIKSCYRTFTDNYRLGLFNLSQLDYSTATSMSDLREMIYIGCDNKELNITINLSSVPFDLGTSYEFIKTQYNKMTKVTYAYGCKVFCSNVAADCTLKMVSTWKYAECAKYVNSFASSLPTNDTGYARTIVLCTDVYNALTDEQKATITNKGYTLSYASS